MNTFNDYDFSQMKNKNPYPKKLSMNVIEYYLSFQATIKNGPYIFLCISSKTSKVLLVSNIFFIGSLSLYTVTQISKYMKSNGSKISLDTCHSILYLEIWSNLFCHNVDKFLLINFPFVLVHLIKTSSCPCTQRLRLVELSLSNLTLAFPLSKHSVR